MSYSEKLVVLRGERTRAEVAAAIGISQSALAMYETGRRMPRDEIKVLLAQFFETTVGHLFFNQE